MIPSSFSSSALYKKNPHHKEFFLSLLRDNLFEFTLARRPAGTFNVSPPLLPSFEKKILKK
jgi:hypothetical protein